MEENICKQGKWQGVNVQIYKQPVQLNIKKNKPPNQEMGRSPKQTFCWRRHTDDHLTHEMMFKILIVREMQIKPKMMYHITCVRMAIIKKFTNNKSWRGSEEKGILAHCWWECKLVQLLWRTIWRFLKKLKIEP